MSAGKVHGGGHGAVKDWYLEDGSVENYKEGGECKGKKGKGKDCEDEQKEIQRKLELQAELNRRLELEKEQAEKAEQLKAEVAKMQQAKIEANNEKVKQENIVEATKKAANKAMEFAAEAKKEIVKLLEKVKKEIKINTKENEVSKLLREPDPQILPNTSNFTEGSGLNFGKLLNERITVVNRKVMQYYAQKFHDEDYHAGSVKTPEQKS